MLMNAALRLHGRPIDSIFELLGTKENDVTYSLGWALAQSPSFRTALLQFVFPGESIEIDQVALQERSGGEGVTDIELSGPTAHLIVEAKRGWQVPASSQFALYSPRLRNGERKHRAFIAMSECTPEFACLHIEKSIDGIPIVHIGWREVVRLAQIKQGTHAEKRLLDQLRTYFQRIVMMQNQESNLVYVVSLGKDTPEWSSLSWIQIVNEQHRYFHPVGTNGWPKEPPNYIAFRYDGCLQSIHHIDSWKVVTDIHVELPELTPGQWPAHFLYSLGPAIRPQQLIKTGGIYRNGRVKAALDLLLTSETIAEARDKTKERMSEL